MTELVARLSPRRSNATRGYLGVPLALMALALCAVVALVLVELLDALELSLTIGLGGGVALLGFVWLAIKRFDTAVVVGLLLMGFVRFQPAPTDACFAVIMVVGAVTGRFRVRRVPLLVRWIIGLLLIVNVLSFMDVVEPTEAFQFFFITAYLLIFSVWFAGYLDSRAKARAVVVTWLIVGVISSVLAVAALYLPIPGRAEILSNVDGGVRAAGFFKDPNVFGPFLVPIAVILMEQLISPRRPRLLNLRPLTSWLALAALSLGVLFSYSRAAWGNYAIAVAVALLASAARRRGTRSAMKALIALLSTAGVAAVVLSATGSIAFLEARARLQTYDTQRFAAQDFGWKLGWTHPVGIGPGQFRFHYPVESHSTFIRTFSEQGFLGLALWVAVLLVTLVFALRNVVRGRDTFGIGSAALLGAWCGLIFNSAVVDTLHWRHLWLVAALIWASSLPRRRQHEPPQQPLRVRASPPNGHGPPGEGVAAPREVPVLAG